MRQILIFGGAGFIGVNAADYFMRQGFKVSILDNLSRHGTEANLRWLKKQGPFGFCHSDIRDPKAVGRWVLSKKNVDLVLHLAAQVAVTTSVLNPREDFEINALGSFNVLEAVRKFRPMPVFIYASTNKVYGEMADVRFRRRQSRYEYANRPQGISEKEPLDFHSPYGCSKGAADQYARDYARIYGLSTIVLRQSCIYGPHQFGNEDQGWVAHFMKAALQRGVIHIYGDGRQVRDVLYVEDLVRCFERVLGRNIKTRGGIYNIGGGVRNTLSLLELVAWIERKLDSSVRLRYLNWRPGDQKVYISDVRKAGRDLGWVPRVSVQEGLNRLWDWLQSGK